MFRIDRSDFEIARCRQHAAALAFGVLFALPANAAGGISDAAVARTTVDVDYALVQLKGEPLSTYSKTKPAQGKKIDFNSATVKSYRAQLSALRNDFKAVAARECAEGEGHRRVRPLAQRGGRQAQRRERWRRSRPRRTWCAPQYEGLYYPTADDPDLDLIHAIDAWNDAGGGRRPTAGDGVKVAIIDTGIDVDASLLQRRRLPGADAARRPPLHEQQGHRRQGLQQQDAEPAATRPRRSSDHGTHVAGTVACNYGTPATVDGVPIPHPISGVAPRALLGNYNIFPADVDERPLRGHPRTPSTPPTPTASTSRT